MAARVQHTANYRRLCVLLRRWRGEASLSQRELAAKLKKPPSFVHKCEVADRRIDPLEFIAWCKACSIDPAKGIQELERQG